MLHSPTRKIAWLEGREYLEGCGILEADLDAWHLLRHFCNITRVDYFMEAEKKILPKDYKQYKEALIMRGRRVPLQHILGTQNFMGFDFIVNKDVLIPRYDTEILVEEVLKQCENKSVLDICTGSGCIIISLDKSTRLKKAVGADISKPALITAKRNKEQLCSEAIFIQSDLFENIRGKYDIIVSNPPYIRTAEIDQLMPEVADYEPRLALDGTEDGLYFYRRIIKESKNYLERNGYLCFEIGFDQAEPVKELFAAEGYREINVVKDLAGKDRVITARMEEDYV